MKLTGKLIISGKIKTLTGLHIGGSKTALEIGGVDLNVIKTPDGVPFIPGSSLKGKMRGLLAREYGSTDVRNDEPHIKAIFGHADKQNPAVTRLIVRDAHLYKDAFVRYFGAHQMEFPYSDIKWENRINRVSGTAIDPRQLERVPAGVYFDCQFVYDVYDDKPNLKKHLDTLLLAFKILQDDYLGGQGSRGYGQIQFEQMSVVFKSLKNGEYEVLTDLNEHQEIKTFSKFISDNYAHSSDPA